MDRQIPPVLQDFVPVGAAALLPLNLNHILLKQGMGTADHFLPLGCYYTDIRDRTTKMSHPPLKKDMKMEPELNRGPRD